MAGGFSDVPGHRVAYDIDGTAVSYYSAGAPLSLDAASIAFLNSDRSVGRSADYDGPNRYFVFVFPQARTLQGIWVKGAGYISAPAYYSTNTTSGMDGTWTSISYPGVSTANLIPSYRTDITTLNYANVKGVRVEENTSRYDFDTRYLSIIHLYATITGTSDRLALWHPTNDVEVGAAYFDTGDVGRSTTGDVSFRIKNLASTKTANSIVVSMDALHDGTPTITSQYSMNINGGAFGSTVSITSLTAGSISQTLVLRRSTNSLALLGPYTMRISAIPTSWS